MAVQRITEAVTHDRAVTIMVDSDSEIADTHLKHVLWCRNWCSKTTLLGKNSLCSSGK